MIKFEGVNFVVSAIKKMSKEKFIKTFLNVYWLDRTEKQRKKMLSDAYDVIVPPQKAED